jgi:beta-mannosidase
MNKTLLLCAILLPVLSAAAQDAGYPRKISLNGTWKYQPIARTTLKADGSIVDDKASLPASGEMTIPSNWHLNGLPDFNGRVRFERDFDFTAGLSSLDRAFLIFHGIDYFAEVEINGTLAGRHEGYFQTFEFDVTPQLRRGRNHIAVIVDAPFEEPGAVWPDHKRMIKGVLSHWDCKPGSVSTKFGQDGTSAGIWNSLELEIRHGGWLGNVKLQPYLYERGLATGHKEEKDLDANPRDHLLRSTGSLPRLAVGAGVSPLSRSVTPGYFGNLSMELIWNQ